MKLSGCAIGGGGIEPDRLTGMPLKSVQRSGARSDHDRVADDRRRNEHSAVRIELPERLPPLRPHGWWGNDQDDGSEYRRAPDESHDGDTFLPLPRFCAWVAGLYSTRLKTMTECDCTCSSSPAGWSLRSRRSGSGSFVSSTLSQRSPNEPAGSLNAIVSWCALKMM